MPETAGATAFLTGGEMGARMRAFDWSASPLGQPAHWPAALQTQVSLVLGSGFPMFLAWGAQRAFLYNDAFISLIGRRHPDSLGQPVRDVWDDVWTTVEPLLDRASAGEAVRAENLCLRTRRNGSAEDAYFTLTFSPARNDAGDVAGVFGAVIETTKQVRNDFELRQLAQTLEIRIESRTLERNQIWHLSRDMLLVADEGGRWLSVNPAWSRVLGWDEGDFIGRTSEWLEHPDDQARTRAEIARLAGGQTTLSFENRFRAKDGGYRTLSWSAVPDEGLLYCTARDVTEERAQSAALQQAEEALRQAQKMEAVGQLTGGLAHDFNNLLAGISGSLELMQTRLQQGRINDLGRYMAAAQGAAKRAAALTHRLLAFSRRQTLDPKPTNVNALVNGMTDLIQRTVGPSISVETVGASGLWPARVDASQLENALLNLCINARDAMPGGGRITIETANKRLDERAAHLQDLPPGHYLSLCVTDTGSGMSPDVIERAFEPFFTTKPLGEGTGLGLSMIYGFAKQSGGQVRIYSEPGEGTTILIYLPRHYGEVTSEAAAETSGALSRSEQVAAVLVVDDEALVRMLVTDILEELGHTVIEAADSAAGLRVLQSDARIDLLITDVGLPGGMNGRQMADAGRVSRPDLKVLFITGYAENAILGNGHLAPGMAVITKPFPMDTMAARIRAMIEAK